MADKKMMVVVGANIADFQKKMNETTKTLNRMGRDAKKSFGPIMDSIGTGLKVMGTAAAAGFGALTAGSVKGASSLEQYRNTLNVVMKDQKKAAETMKWAVDFANKTPFDTTSVVDATVKLQSYGVVAKDVLPQIGDMAAVMNKDLNQAVEAIADAQTGELERLKEFGITKQMIIDEGNRVMRGKELVNAKGQIVDQENFNKALFSLMNQKFKGGMEIQATSFKGLWSTVVGVAQSSLATFAGITATGEVIAGGLFETVKQGIQLVVNKLGEWQKDGTLQQWAEAATNAFKSFMAVATPIVEKLIQFGKWIYDNWSLIAPVLAGVVAGFLAFKTAIVVIEAAKLAMAAFNAIMAMNPIGLVVLAIAALVAGGVALYQNWDVVKAKALELWGNLKETFGGIKSFVLGVWDAIVSGIKGAINAVIKSINSMIAGLNKISIKVPGWVPGMGGKSWGISIPKIPMLAEGGIVTKPTLAMIGEAGPEAVVPLGRGNKTGGTGNTYNFHIYDATDPEKVGRVVESKIRQLALEGAH